MQEAKERSYRDPESRRQYIKKIIRKILNNKNSKPRKEYEKNKYRENSEQKKSNLWTIPY